ncbi:MAG: IS30 family transposase [Candidatus Omnitrophica bacterium]|nr:IS30 family transposase [Candidatus Omnitrophota bacterium]
MNHYHRISLKEREEISRMLATNQSMRSIARLLARAPSSISRELRRHARHPIGYRAVSAQRYATRMARKPRKKRLLEIYPKLRKQVLQYLAQLWSPEQIAKELSLRYPNHPRMNISHESIYTYLYALPRGQLKRELIAYLRQHHQLRRPRYRQRLKPKPIQDIISIEERPSEVATRTIPGHWEGDLLMGHGNASALGTLVERVTRFTLLVPLKAKNAPSARRAFSRELRTLPQQLKRY